MVDAVSEGKPAGVSQAVDGRVDACPLLTSGGTGPLVPGDRTQTLAHPMAGSGRDKNIPSMTKGLNVSSLSHLGQSARPHASGDSY